MTAAKKKSAKAATPRSMPKEGKDPKGGLTDAGRRFFAETEGAHLKPGVKGKADTPEKMVRKGSFLRRHYANPRGPVVDAKGEPTRQALQAAAWGEPVPKSTADEKKLAAKGKKLLEQYHTLKGDTPGKAAHGKAAPANAGNATFSKKAAAKKVPAKKAAGTKAAAKKVAAKKSVAGSTGARATRSSPAKASAGKKASASRAK